jgi:hypothetical protein
MPIALHQVLPKLRDSEQSGNWYTDVISAFVILKNDDETYLRLASVSIWIEDWLVADPIPEIVDLV